MVFLNWFQLILNSPVKIALYAKYLGKLPAKKRELIFFLEQKATVK